MTSQPSTHKKQKFHKRLFLHFVSVLFCSILLNKIYWSNYSLKHTSLTSPSNKMGLKGRGKCFLLVIRQSTHLLSYGAHSNGCHHPWRADGKTHSFNTRLPRDATAFPSFQRSLPHFLDLQGRGSAFLIFIRYFLVHSIFPSYSSDRFLIRFKACPG